LTESLASTSHLLDNPDDHVMFGKDQVFPKVGDTGQIMDIVVNTIICITSTWHLRQKRMQCP